jgi:shikimate dehydrogenase
MKQFGLIGNPLTHSFSKTYFTKKFDREHILDCAYELYPLTNIDQFPSLITDHKLSGINVTIPYKESIIPFLDSLSEEADEIRAVNCIVHENGRLIGHNTDCFGFEISIAQWIANSPKRALILGDGGSAKAVKYVLKKLNIDFRTVSRKGKLNYENLPASLVAESKLIINTTPLGMSPNLNETPDIPFDAIGSQHFVFDLIYNPIETLLLKTSKIAGAKTKNGLEMLELQAERSWEIWMRLK